MTKSHSHGDNTWADPTVVRYLIADDGTFGSIHDETDVSLDTTDFDIGFSSSEDTAGAIIVVIDKRFNADSGRFAVISYLLMGDGDIVQIF